MPENKPVIYSDLAKIDATTESSARGSPKMIRPEFTDEWFEKADLYIGETSCMRRGRGRPPLDSRRSSSRSASIRSLDAFPCRRDQVGSRASTPHCASTSGAK